MQCVHALPSGAWGDVKLIDCTMELVRVQSAMYIGKVLHLTGCRDAGRARPSVMASGSSSVQCS